MEPSTRHCDKCNKSILSQNYMIHQAMCRGLRDSQLFRSRVIDPDEEIWNAPVPPTSTNCNPTNGPPTQQPTNPFKKQPATNVSNQQPHLHSNTLNNFIPQTQQHLPRVNPSNNTQMNTRALSNGFTQNQYQQSMQQQVRQQPILEQERFSCPDCGYRMTMNELDTHPSSCKVKKSKCEYCRVQYPNDLMADHHSVCSQRNQNQARNSNRETVNHRRQPPIQPGRQHGRETSSQNQVVEHYHFVDQQGQQMCATVRIDRNGNRQTSTRPANSQQNRQLNMSGNPFLALLSMFTGLPTSGGFNLQFNSGNGGYSNQFSRSSPMSFERMVAELIGTMNIAPENRRPLETQMLKKLPIVKFDKSIPQHGSCSNCTICMTEYENGDQLIQLPCGHLFNKQCIVPWLKTSSLCPNCRQPIKIGTKPSHSNSNQPTNIRYQNRSTNPLGSSQRRQEVPRVVPQNIRTTVLPNSGASIPSYPRPINPFSSSIPPSTRTAQNSQSVNPSTNANSRPQNPFGNRGRNDW